MARRRSGLDGPYKSKEAAKQAAQDYRDDGCQARVVQVGAKWYVAFDCPR